LAEIDFHGKEVIDTGCGTGIFTFLAMDAGALKVVSGDISEYMLGRAKENAIKLGYNSS
jgi:ribosomal protein L11 methylase PrmA